MIKLLNPHFENPNITHIDEVEVTPTEISFRWSDGTRALGSPVTISRVALPATPDAEPIILDPADAVAAYLQSAAANVQELPLESRMYQRWMELPAEIRGPFMKDWQAINGALELGDIAGAIEALKAAAVPTELEPLRQEFLAMFAA